MDQAARFEQIYRSHGARILAYCMRRIDGPGAQDAAAETFMTCWRRIDDVPDGDAQIRWLYGVAANAVRNVSRSSRRVSRLRSRLAGLGHGRRESGPEVHVVRNERQQLVLDAVRALPEQYREPLLLAEWDGVDRKNIAVLLKISRNAVDKRISRAYRQLEKLLPEELGAHHAPPSAAPTPRTQEGRAI